MDQKAQQLQKLRIATLITDIAWPIILLVQGPILVGFIMFAGLFLGGGGGGLDLRNALEFIANLLVLGTSVLNFTYYVKSGRRGALAYIAFAYGMISSLILLIQLT